ncbi:uncharacterized protein LOC126322592 [Schistocerca gregaria]|uniref:uncharacterized protein LOC126322592 n=1 Tax=Schistocerca gregaria TaxID=7010 RepID=UPI00211E5A27|nr:uncharacterized protein LOC126322592 [Schistocerca gregaria]
MYCLHCSPENESNEHAKIFHKRMKFVRCVGHSLQCVSVSWNATGDRLASGSTDKSILLWNALGSKLSGSTARKHDDEVNRVQWAPSDVHSFCSCSKDKTLRLWDERQPDQTAIINLEAKESNKAVTSGEGLAWHSNGNEIAVIVTNQDLSSQVQIVDVRMNTVGRYLSSKKTFTDLAWSSIYQDMLILTTEDGSVIVANGSSLDLNSFYTLEAHSGVVQTVDVDPTGKRFATGSSDSIINLWSIRDITCERSVNNSESSVRCVRFSSNGKFLASSTDKKVWINHCETGKVVGQIPQMSDEKKISDAPQGIWCLAWNPKRYTLAFGGERAFLGMTSYENSSL